MKWETYRLQPNCPGIKLIRVKLINIAFLGFALTLTTCYYFYVFNIKMILQT